jgi:hypothetical protein
MASDLVFSSGLTKADQLVLQSLDADIRSHSSQTKGTSNDDGMAAILRPFLYPPANPSQKPPSPRWRRSTTQAMATSSRPSSTASIWIRSMP